MGEDRLYDRSGNESRTGRERARERQLAEHVSRRKERGGRPAGRARGLSRADIVAAAVAVADAEGTGAVSMRRIAKDLQVGVMSLYWHVDAKEELHQLMLDTVQAEIEAVDPSGDWRADLAVYARNARAAVHRHPWAVDYIGAGPPAGPNDARNADRLVAALDGLGLDLTTTMWIVLTLGTYVMGAALREIQEVRWQRATDETLAGMTEAEIARAHDEFEQQLREYGGYPHLAKVLDAGIDPDAPETREMRFEFGLSCLLDGIAARIRELAEPATGTISSGPAASVTRRPRGPVRASASACPAHSS